MHNWSKFASSKPQTLRLSSTLVRLRINNPFLKQYSSPSILFILSLIIILILGFNQRNVIQQKWWDVLRACLKIKGLAGLFMLWKWEGYGKLGWVWYRGTIVLGIGLCVASHLVVLLILCN